MFFSFYCILFFQYGKLIDTCPDCGGKVYIIGGAGSPLSYSRAWGYCPDCGQKQCEQKMPSDIWKPMIEHIKKFPNKDIIERGKRSVFSWDKGLKGESNPDKVIKKKVIGVSLQTLLEKLKK